MDPQKLGCQFLQFHLWFSRTYKRVNSTPSRDVAVYC